MRGHVPRRGTILFTAAAVVVSATMAASRHRGDDVPPPVSPKQAEVLLRAAQGANAALLDAALPTATLEEWLLHTLQTHIEPPWTMRVAWALEYCEHASTGVAASGALCADAKVPLAPDPEIAVTVRVRVGRIGRTGAVVAERPAMYEALIERKRDTLRVPRLSALPRLLQIPFEQWPRPAEPAQENNSVAIITAPVG